MKEYEIKKETVEPGYFLDEKKQDGSVERKFIKTGGSKEKWYIYYYIDGILVDKALYSYDGVNPINDYKITEGFADKGTGVKVIEKIDISKLDIQAIVNEIKKEYVLNPKTK